MWIRTQSNGIEKVDNIYTHNGSVICTYNGETVIELGRYTSEKRTNEVIDLFWNCLVNGGKTFCMPK